MRTYTDFRSRASAEVIDEFLYSYCYYPLHTTALISLNCVHYSAIGDGNYTGRCMFAPIIIIHESQERNDKIYM